MQTTASQHPDEVLRVLADAFDTAATTCGTKEQAAQHIAATLLRSDFQIISADSYIECCTASRRIRSEAITLNNALFKTTMPVDLPPPANVNVRRRTDPCAARTYRNVAIAAFAIAAIIYWGPWW